MTEPLYGYYCTKCLHCLVISDDSLRCSLKHWFFDRVGASDDAQRLAAMLDKGVDCEDFEDSYLSDDSEFEFTTEF